MPLSRQPATALLTLLACALPFAVPIRAQLEFDRAQFFHEDLAALPDAASSFDDFGHQVASGDFNCDGFQDLAVGAPYEGLPPGEGEIVDEGQVTVIFGSASGLDPSTSFLVNQNLGLLPGGGAGFRHFFGLQLAAGNFDGDDFMGRPCDDLVIAAPGLEVDSATSAGGVFVVPGRELGFQWPESQLLTQDLFPGGAPEASDFFGMTLAIGDFDGDGFDDLAIAAPFENEELPGGTVPNAGSAHVIFGSAVGLSTSEGTAPQTLTADSLGLASFDGAQFGDSLASGDFDRTAAPTFDDLAIGISGYEVDGLEGAGAAVSIHGSVAGLDAAGFQLLSEDIPGLAEGAPGMEHYYGSSVAAGDFDGDGRDDLAVGITFHNYVPGASEVGAVRVLYSDGAQLAVADSVLLWRQDLFGTWDSEDWFGFSLRAADFDRDGLDDLAISVPMANVEGVQNAGLVHVARSHATRDFTAQSTLFQATEELGSLESDDYLGTDLVVGDFDGDGSFDLAVGVPLEGIGGHARAGAVNVFYGRGRLFTDGFESGGTSAWSTSSP